MDPLVLGSFNPNTDVTVLSLSCEKQKGMITGSKCMITGPSQYVN